MGLIQQKRLQLNANKTGDIGAGLGLVSQDKTSLDHTSEHPGCGHRGSSGIQVSVCLQQTGTGLTTQMPNKHGQSGLLRRVTSFGVCLLQQKLFLQTLVALPFPNYIHTSSIFNTLCRYQVHCRYSALYCI